MTYVPEDGIMKHNADQEEVARCYLSDGKS